VKKNIKDPVHGYITLNANIQQILDHPAVQRLRYIRQLGFSYLVYPGAHNTRFEHSLGTMHLAAKAATHFSLTSEECALVTVSALLHDIGHGPYSHAVEPLIKEELGLTHTGIADLLKKSALQEQISSLDVCPEDVVEMIEGKHPLAEIIHGDLDVDRMDYLLRDAHHTGVTYGAVDCDRLIQSLYHGEKGLIIKESGIQAAESLLIARTLMRPAVYFHHVSRIAEKMFQHAVWCAMQEKEIAPAKLARQDDAACMQALLQSKNDATATLAQRLYYRNLYKRALYAQREELYLRQWNWQNHRDEREYARAIAEHANVLPEQVLVDIPPFPRDIQVNVFVQKRHDVIPLEEISPLVTALNEARRSQWRLGVYAPSEVMEKVTAAAQDIFHLKQPTTQKRLS
jgi:HD superfamily phosphohydrolase